MFRHEGSTRTPRHDRALAGYLALVAGYVNSAGFILIGSFTSHVTGNIGRMADDLAFGKAAAFFGAGTLVISYFIGAFVASMALESNVWRRVSVYGILLLGEAGLLASFAILSYVMDTQNPRFKDVQAILLCLAMGLQNSFVTRLSGAVVRTTHLTGAVTDLGIEGARWFRHWRARLGQRTHVRLVAGTSPPVVPHPPRTILLLTIIGAFVVGSVCGALLVTWAGQLALLVPTGLLAGAAGFALTREREIVLSRE